MNETIELDHDIEGLEEILSFPCDILETLNKESDGSKPNIEEIEVVNLVDEGENEKTRQDRGKLSYRHEAWAQSDTQRIQKDLCLVLPRHARVRYWDCYAQNSS